MNDEEVVSSDGYRGTSLIRERPPLGPYCMPYLAYKKTHPPRTLPYAYAYGPRGVLGEWAFSYERGTPVQKQLSKGKRRRVWHPHVDFGSPKTTQPLKNQHSRG